jgi:hypothetical protein
MRKHVFWIAPVILEIFALIVGVGIDQRVWGQEDKSKVTPEAELPSPDADGFITVKEAGEYVVAHCNDGQEPTWDGDLPDLRIARSGRVTAVAPTPTWGALKVLYRD